MKLTCSQDGCPCVNRFLDEEARELIVLRPKRRWEVVAQIVSEGLPIEVDVPSRRRVGVGVLHVAQAQAVGSRGSPRHGRRRDPRGSRRVAADLWRRRVHAELVLGRNMTVARCTVELVMRRLGLAGLPGRPKYRKIPNTPTASDLVNRDFARSEPNRLWLTDITEHPTREGKVYCAVVLDAFSRRVVGWSIDSSQTANLVVNALGMAIENRQGRRRRDPQRPRHPIHLVGVHAPRARLRAGAIDGIDRRLLRQRPDGIVLGPDAGRATQPQAMEHPPRARQRDLRVP